MGGMCGPCIHHGWRVLYDAVHVTCVRVRVRETLSEGGKVCCVCGRVETNKEGGKGREEALSEDLGRLAVLVAHQALCVSQHQCANCHAVPGVRPKRFSVCDLVAVLMWWRKKKQTR